jgi:hypothetical protein
MKLQSIFLFIAGFFFLSFAQAKYTCSALFIEEITLEQQFKNVFDLQKITLIREIPKFSDEPIHLQDIDLKPGDEFVARLLGLNQLFGSPIPNNSLSTYNINGIRNMAFKIIEVGPEQTNIEIPVVNAAVKIYRVNTQKLKNLYAYPIKDWDKTLFDMKIIFDRSKPGYYSLNYFDPEGLKQTIASIHFDEDGFQLEILLSDTSFLFRKNHLNTVLLKKILQEFPQIHRISGELEGTNKSHFLKALLNEISPMIPEQIQNLSLPEQVRALILGRTEDQLNAALKKAFQHTPFYKANQNLGFGRIGKVKLESTDENEDKILIEVESLRDN